MKLAISKAQRIGNRYKDRNDKGYALISLLAGLTILIIAMSAAVPSIKQEAQRELEEEMFFRGQQVGFALSRYRAVRGRLPGKLEELAEKVQTPKGDVRFLRPSALCDPLMPCEEGKPNWKPARPGDSVFSTFLQAYLALQAKYPERLYPPPPAELVQLAQLGSQQAQLGAGGEAQGPQNTEFNSKLSAEFGPIYGVVSRSTKPMIRNYLDLPSYDQSLFYTGFVIDIGGIHNPVSLIAGREVPGAARPTPDSRCPNGGMWWEQDGKGYCAGTIRPGKYCRGPDGTTILCPDGQQK